ncbi:hypothetical protein LTS08_004344 [Lithohypha guttulata]|nr:hypothetical protein LTS08_004344 [Lithohypha guttulata]
MAATAHQYATLPLEDDRSPLSSTAFTPSPTFPEHDLPYTPFSVAFEDLGGSLSTDEHPSAHQQSIPDVLKSLTSSHLSTQSYELVEEDDYEHAQITPRLPKKMADVMADAVSSKPKEDTPVRTASISRNLPLHNPTPDLQSLQGAYVRNVQALEDSAERMSLAGSIEEELQRMKADMRRSESLKSAGYRSRQYSTTSMSNSIIGVNAAARSGGHMASSFITSPVGSISHTQPVQRTTRLSKTSNPLPEPELEGRPLESAMTHSPPAHAMQPRPSTDDQRPSSGPSVQERPGTSASNDTYRQAQNLFTDFDGIHFSPDEETFGKRISLTHPPLARDSKVYREAQPDQKMVYYPAPVPVMLNLPKRLSRGDWAQQQKRRTIALQSIPADNRKSAIWLANAETDAEYEVETPKRRSQIPPQLRASAFFDAPGQRTDIQLEHDSAVKTLDSILDAAAHAPVSAFTDHPIVGQLGKEVYGQAPQHRKRPSETKQRRKSSLSNILGKRKSTGTLNASRRMSQTLDIEVGLPDDDPEREADRSIAPDIDELVEHEKTGYDDGEEQVEGDEEEEPEEEYQYGFHNAPTTLLAELQMRKAQQKLRNRTAANAFSTGMHSTLLELDAVSQLQQKARKQKHVALAWEDKAEVDRDNFEDEDIPLGVLFPEKERQSHVNLNRPLGLMARKELEENEPLSSRRARLRGEPYKPTPHVPEPSPAHADPAPVITLAGIDDEAVEEGPEEETLAQRRQRMRGKQNRRSSLADEVASQLGLDAEQIRRAGSQNSEAVGEQEETLGQRRQRLQAEAEKAAPALKPKTSMGDLLRANPVGFRNEEQQASAESKINLLLNRRNPATPLVGHIQAAQPGNRTLPHSALQSFDQRSPPPYFPNQPLLQLHQQQQQQQQMYASAMQSMPNLTTVNGFNGNYGMNSFGLPQQQQQSPYNNPSMNMTTLGLSMNGTNNMNMGMMYNPMAAGMPMQMPMMPPGYDHIGMGPPLNSQQRASIDRWRQGIA